MLLENSHRTYRGEGRRERRRRESVNINMYSRVRYYSMVIL
jgi:hypothetical protein